MDCKPKMSRLPQLISRSLNTLSSCNLCPRSCGVNRTRGEKGVCNTADKAVVYGFMPHHGEEPPLSGTCGSGTIFFSYCNLQCCFCQNEDISIRGEGEPAEPGQMARAMIHLQELGCHNINVVTPTHVVPFILQALELAIGMGLTLPLVYNSSGYETPETLDLLDGIVDVYMPDFKFWDPRAARMACGAPDYPQITREAIKIMHGQVGDLVLDDSGLAQKGLLVRHLVMPEDLAGSKDIMKYLSCDISPNTAVNVMSQYRPVGRAKTISQLSRPVNSTEFRQAVDLAKQYGLRLVG